MTELEMIKTIEELREWEELLEAAKTEVEARKDALKGKLLLDNTEEQTAGRYIVRFTSVLSNRFDTTAFKRNHPDLYKAYTKQSESRRFTVSD